MEKYAKLCMANNYRLQEISFLQPVSHFQPVGVEDMMVIRARHEGMYPRPQAGQEKNLRVASMLCHIPFLGRQGNNTVAT